jgi:hypothetical protein
MMLLLEHENGIIVPDAIRKMHKNHAVHDPSDLNAARAMADHEEHIPIGLLFQDESRPCYCDYTKQGVDMTSEQRLAGLERVLDALAI